MSNRIAQLITDKKEHLEQIKQSLRPDLRYSSLGPTPDEIAEALPFLIEKIESGIVEEQIKDGINRIPNLLYLVLGLPLQQAVPYLTSDPHFLPDNISIPNTHRETDPSALFSVLQKMTRLQRNRLLDAFPNVNTTDYLILQQALVEPNIEALKIVLEKESIDISEIQKVFGLLLDAQEFTEIIKPDLASDDVTLDVFFQFFEELFPLIASDLYESELYVESVDLMRKKQGNDHIAPETLNKWVTNLTALRLKSYWYCRDSYCDKEAKIIDDYINNPYFEPFVSKCRAEFEEEERLRAVEDDSAERVVTEVKQEKRLRENTTINRPNKGSWLKNPREKYYEGELGLDIKDNVWLWIHDQVCQLQYDSLKGTNREKKIKYTCAIFIHQAAVSLGYANSLSDNAASSFEKVMKFAGIKRQTLKQYDEMMEAYYTKIEQDYDDFSNDHEGTYFDIDANTMVHHGAVGRDNSDFRARHPKMALFLAKNYEDITKILDGIKPKLRSLLLNYI